MLNMKCRRKHVSKATEGPFRNIAKKAARMVRLLRELRKLRAHFVGSAMAMKSFLCGSFAGLLGINSQGPPALKVGICLFIVMPK